MRLINKATGVTISLDESAASRLGPEWEPVKPAPAKKAPAKKAAAKPAPDSK